MTMTRPTTEQITHKGQLLSSYLDAQFNLKDFGAVGDGVTDDMDALIAAVNAVKAAGGGTLYIPNTPNGYYLRRGVGCQLAGTNGISIVSNGATLKLQGGTLLQTSSTAVFTSSFAAGVQNFLIQGLRFESASTVLRYGNGLSSPRHFEDECDDGKADPNEQCSFRYGISLNGSSSNITIRDCHFGNFMFVGVKVSSSFGGPKASNVRLQNLSFHNHCEQAILVSDINGLSIDGIDDVDHKGSKFDWTLYLSSGLENVVVSNVRIRQSVQNISFGASAITMDKTPSTANQAVFSNILLENVGNNGISLNAANVTMSSVTLRASGQLGTGAINAFGGSNVVISGLVLDTCPVGMSFSPSGTASNFSVSNFVFSNCNTAVNVGTPTFASFACGRFVDCGALGLSRTILAANSSVARRLNFAHVEFVYDTYVPTQNAVDARGANTALSFSNCTWRSNFGTSSVPCIYATTSARVEIDSCAQSGYSGGLTYASSAGVGVTARIAEMPSLESVLAANSATPSVLGNALFVTANSSATAITNFTDGVQGQDICVRVNDANTTFDFSGSNLKGNNGVDYVATSGDLVFAKRIGSNWFCTVCEA
jgi:hypothetical protein